MVSARSRSSPAENHRSCRCQWGPKPLLLADHSSNSDLPDQLTELRSAIDDRRRACLVDGPSELIRVPGPAWTPKCGRTELAEVHAVRVFVTETAHTADAATTLGYGL